MDKKLFTALVLKKEDTLYRVAKSILQREQDVEDAVQEGILKAYKKQNTLKNPQYFGTWLTRIVINECYDVIRKRKDELPLSEITETCCAQEAEDYSELYEAIAKLPPKIRITIVLYYVEGYSTEEIKTILKIPQGTVKSRLNKGRKLLESFLKDEGEHHGTKKMARNLSQTDKTVS